MASLTRAKHIAEGSPTPSPGIQRAPSRSLVSSNGHNFLASSGVTISHSIPQELSKKKKKY